MIILQINASYGLGSTGHIVEDIKSIVEQEQGICYVAYPLVREDLRNEPNGYRIGNWIDHKLHAVLCRFYGKQAYFSTFPTLRLIRFIKKIKPDVIHFHNLHSNYINLPLLLKYIASTNTKLLLTLHDCWFFTGGCFHYTRIGCKAWQSDCGNCPKRLCDTPAFLGDRSSRILLDRKKLFSAVKNLTVVGVSNWIAGEARKGLFHGRAIKVIHNGVDVSVFKPTESDIKKRYQIEDKFVILGPASKWFEEANKDALDYFMNQLEADECLILFGCTVPQKVMPSNIIQLGFTNNREELAALYTTADVFVNLTHEDSLSMINLESQACGTQVLTYGNTGAKETVDGVFSRIVETDDYVSLLKQVREIKASRSSKSREGCIAFIRENFEKQRSCNKYIELYRSLCQ